MNQVRIYPVLILTVNATDMKKLLFLFTALALVLSACNNDDDDDNGPSGNTLSYDGPNATAPFLPTGLHELAARFTSQELTNYVGQDLAEVSFFLANIPQTCTIKIYGQGTRDAPGTLLYSATVSNSLAPFSWNNHRIQAPIEITGDDLWISIAVTHGGNLQSVGCDAGPADAGGNGDRILLDGNGAWSDYRQLANESINWNIRGIVE